MTRIIHGVWSDLGPAERKSFTSSLPLKRCVDELVLRTLGEVISSDEEESLFVPADRFVNPAGTLGYLVESRSAPAQYHIPRISDTPLDYTAVWPIGAMEQVFERIRHGGAELYVYGTSVFRYPHADMSSGIFSRTSSEEKLFEHVLAHVADGLPREDRGEFYASILGRVDA